MGSASLQRRLPEGVGRSLSFSGLSFLLSERSLERLKRDLGQAGARKITPSEWASASLFTALVFAALAAFVGLAATSDALMGLAFGFLGFALVFAVAFNYPKIAAAKRAEEIERDFAVALRAIAIQLAAGASFESVLRRETRGGSELSGEFARVLREAERTGLGVALSAAGARCASPLAQRAFAQLRFAAEHGGGSAGSAGSTGGESLRKLADELVSAQKTKAREFAAKQAFFGLLFVSVACIAPALFAAYVIVGGAFLELSFGATEVLLAFIVLFPLVDAAILVFLLWKTPKLLSS
jgi:hypothetical protein